VEVVVDPVCRAAVRGQRRRKLHEEELLEFLRICVQDVERDVHPRVRVDLLPVDLVSVGARLDPDHVLQQLPAPVHREDVRRVPRPVALRRREQDRAGGAIGRHDALLPEHLLRHGGPPRVECCERRRRACDARFAHAVQQLVHGPNARRPPVVPVQSQRRKVQRRRRLEHFGLDHYGSPAPLAQR
jgi:hypothetical protein